ncbi:MAG: RagB/SusD family nutrient uptake outer membrane protein [Rikenellaceae bacterium]|nr:RagB/SusD family nutrient uptake outer membrane protein [Rikenellaceae bacterium]MCL2692050.1 RagB/SusD family nutrient uptake outer membrane protein [Rikenellaceae bacterium]
MKRITRKISLLLLAAVLFAGCQSWFDVQPKSEIKADRLFQSEEGFWDALTGVYIGMTSQDLYGANLSWGAIEFMAWYHINADNRGSWFELQSYDYTAPRSERFITSVWLKMYNVISEINYLLEALDKHGNILDPKVFNAIKGEALALRAYCHFDLIRLFARGNLANNQAALDMLCIPYVKTHSKHRTPQKSYRETIGMLMNDIEQALTYLDIEEVPASTRFNMNYLAALQLKTRVAQWTNDTNTLAYALELIDLLETARVTSWVIDGTRPAANTPDVFATELLFCLDVHSLRTFMATAYVNFFQSNVNRDLLINSKEFMDELFFGSPYGTSESDLRYQNWYNVPIQTNDNVPTTSRLSVKVRQPDTGAGANTIPLMRISEPYLIAAESLVGTDNKQAADYINLLRSKRNATESSLLPGSINDDDLRAVIRREYRREFTQEGQLFFYYKRKGVARIPGMAMVVGDMTDESYTLPYPLSEISQ